MVNPYLIYVSHIFQQLISRICFFIMYYEMVINVSNIRIYTSLSKIIHRSLVSMRYVELSFMHF